MAKFLPFKPQMLIKYLQEQSEGMYFIHFPKCRIEEVKSYLIHAEKIVPRAKFRRPLRPGPWHVGLDELMVVPGIQDTLNKWELLLLLQKWSVCWMFSSSPPTHPKIGCANHLHIWEQDPSWAKKEPALAWRRGRCVRWA